MATQIQLGLLYSMTYTLKFESEGKLRTKGYDKTDYFYIPIMYFPLIYEATSNQQLHMKYTSLSSCDIPEIVVPIRIPVVEDCFIIAR